MGPTRIGGEMTAMDSEALYRRDGDRYVPSDGARGPWDPKLQHGGPIAGLIARAAESFPCAQPMRVVRLTIDLFRPIPMAATTITIEAARDGRRIQALDVNVIVDDTVVTRASIMRIRDEPGTVEPANIPEPPPVDAPPAPPDSVAPVVFRNMAPQFVHQLDIRRVSGAESGTSTAWYRLDSELVEGEPISPLQRMSAIADLGMSAGHLVSFDRFTSANPDLTIHVDRLPDGPWIGLDGVVRIHPGGLGITDSVIHDVGGRIGRSVKCLLVDRR